MSVPRYQRRPPSAQPIKSRPRHHRVADFNTLDDLIRHAARDLGATHVSGTDANTKLYFPRGGQHPYEEASVWRKSGYWHSQGPSARTGVRGLPVGAKPIGGHGGRRAAEAPRRSKSDIWIGTGRDAGPYEVHPSGEEFAFEEFVVVNSKTGHVRAEAMSRDDAIRLAKQLNHDQRAGHAVRDYIAVDQFVPKGRAAEARRGGVGTEQASELAVVNPPTTSNGAWTVTVYKGHTPITGANFASRAEIDRWLKASFLGIRVIEEPWTPRGHLYPPSRHRPRASEARPSPRGGSTRRVGNRAPQMTPESVMKIAGDLSRKVGGSTPKHVGAHRWSEKNESATFMTHSPEYSQPVVVLVSVFEDGAVVLDFFSDEARSELDRYESIGNFVYGGSGHFPTNVKFDLGEMAADLKWVWETVDGYAASWQEDGGGMLAERSRSIAITRWAGDQALTLEWERGPELKGWSRADGERAIETSGDPVWESDDGFESAWKTRSLEGALEDGGGKVDEARVSGKDETRTRRSIHMGKTPDGHEFLPPTIGSDLRYAYVPFARLSSSDQSRARAAYPHKRVGGMYDFKDEHYYYPVKADGSLARGSRFLAIPRAWFDDASIMQSLGYATPNSGWERGSVNETRSAHRPPERTTRRRAKR